MQSMEVMILETDLSGWIYDRTLGGEMNEENRHGVDETRTKDKE